jgi:hypothetical protein
MSIFRAFSRAVGLEVEKPSFIILDKLNDNIEIRKYSATKWVNTSVYCEARHLQLHSNNLFFKLFAYINGNNVSNQKISMTAPVLYDLTSLSRHPITPSTPLKLHMKFFVPQSQQIATPLPYDDLSIEKTKEITMICIKFGGYAKLDDFLRHRDELIRKLGSNKNDYDCVNILLAAYDAPFKPIGRTNEVWLKKISR